MTERNKGKERLGDRKKLPNSSIKTVIILSL